MKQLTPNQLALYLGCEAEITYMPAGLNVSPKKQDVIITPYTLQQVEKGIFFNVKPRLKLLSSITEEEAKECFKGITLEPGQIKKYLSIVGINGITLKPEQFTYLLSKRICLFEDWFEKGLAIDITTINHG